MTISGETTAAAAANVRRTADFHPTVWGDFFVTHVFNTHEQMVDGWKQEIEELKQDVKAMLETPTGKLSEKLEMIDVVERLGIGYHFEHEIKEQLRRVYDDGNVDETGDLSTVAIQFRLLRQHGYNVTSEIFNNFKNEERSFKNELGIDIRGLLALYEAAYLRKHGETILDEAIEFTTTHLTNLVVEDGQFSLSRYLVTKSTILVSITDDMYDVHGTIDELELFTAAVERWDISMKDLPEYMRLFYEALIDLMDEIDSITSKQGRSFCAEYVRQAEKKQMRAYLAEARWFAKGKVPTIQEYRRVGVYTSTYPLLACSALCGMGDKAPKEVFDWLMADPKIMVAVSDHCRLMDDIVSHEFEQKRGHVASAIECYMKQYDASRKQAVSALNQFLEDDWKDINEECLQQPGFVSNEVLSMFVGLAKVMEVLYKEFDSYTFSDTATRDMMTALLVTPIVD
ncbi:Probable terpene synthase 3 [Linum perenne]